MQRNLGKRAIIVMAGGIVAAALTAGVALAAPVLQPGVTSAPGMSGVCTDCHVYAQPTPPPVVTPPTPPAPPVVTPPTPPAPPVVTPPTPPAPPVVTPPAPPVVTPPTTGEGDDKGDVEKAPVVHKAKHHKKSHVKKHHERD